MNDKHNEEKWVNALFDVYARAKSGDLVMADILRRHHIGVVSQEALLNLGLLTKSGHGRGTKWTWSHKGFPTVEMAKEWRKEFKRLGRLNHSKKDNVVSIDAKPRLSVTEQQVSALFDRKIAMEIVAINELREAMTPEEHRKLIGAFNIVAEYYGVPMRKNNNG